MEDKGRKTGKGEVRHLEGRRSGRNVTKQKDVTKRRERKKE